MKTLLTLLFSLSIFFCFAQEVKKEEKVLFIVDNVPIIDEPEDGAADIKQDDIDNLVVVTDPEKIKQYGYPTVGKIILVFTKEYAKRPDDIKKIPTTKIMIRKANKLFLPNSTTPYTGLYIDYYFSGKREEQGEIKDGVLNGLTTAYYENGNKNYFTSYVNGIEEGDSEEYFSNGKLKQKGSYKSGHEDGLWQDFYSTGDIKRQTTFVSFKPIATKEEEKFYSLQDDAIKLMREGDYASSVKKLDQAEKINSKYSDLYFYRGTAKLDNYDFDNAIVDFNKAIELEPLYMEAIANRAFARIRKYQFKNSRPLSKTSEVTVLAVKDKVDIPADEKEKICVDLNKSFELGDTNKMIVDAIQEFCK